MATIIKAPRMSYLPVGWSLDDIQKHVGGISLKRIRSYPPPGFATIEDVEDVRVDEKHLCELIDGILVEKTMGWYESMLAIIFARELSIFVKNHVLGKVLGADGTLQLLPNMVRIPDVCFISWSRFPNGQLPREPIPNLVPDLAIEILSDSNTADEMERKRRDDFQAGVRLVWYVDPRRRSATVYTSADDPGAVHSEAEPLSGENVLPGFTLSLAEIFQEADREAGQQ